MTAPDQDRPAIVRTLLRLALADRPGALATVTRCLAACGVDIHAVEVVGHHEGEAIDDLLVSGGDLDRALAALVGDVRVLGRIVGGALPDPAVAMAEAFARVLTAESLEVAREATVAAAVSLCGADDGVLLRAGEEGRLTVVAATRPGLADIAADDPAVARRALRSVRPLTAAGDSAWGPAAYRRELAGEHVLALPVEGPELLVLLVVRRTALPFVEAEVERLSALVGTVLGGGARPTDADVPARLL